jgi:tetratricopeptide (TPR) repeat protein
MANNVDIWAWTYKDRARLVQEGRAKKAIVENYQKFWNFFHNDNISAELAINEALEAARATGEIRWELHLRHWRLQFWLTQYRIREMLPEAIDLLSLAVDERVKDVPQRICAYHDIVECYVQMDPAGYAEEIKENAQDILAQLPRRHPCADCARGNLARAMAAAGRAEESRHWIAEQEANRHERRYTGMLQGRARTYLFLQDWAEAERHYLEACEVARKERQSTDYQESLLGVARARLGRGDIAGAEEIMRRIRRGTKYEGETNLLALLLEVEGYLAEAHKVPQAAIGYFTRAAKMDYELGRYRDAAEIALHAAELARAKELPDSETETALEIAARAVGMMPPASKDVYQRLEALGRQPAEPEASAASCGTERISEEQSRAAEARKERAGIEEVLQSHIQSGNAHGMISMLFRLGIWHDTHDEPRAAVDYFLWSAALERLLKFPLSEREDSLAALKHMRDRLPAGAVETALKAAENAPPAQLIPLLSNLSDEQWQWIIQAIAAEVTGKPVVEPEPKSKNHQRQFKQWLGHCASMTALIVRFREQADPAKCERWAVSLEETAQEMENQLGEHRNEPGALAVPSFARGLAALSRGASIEEVSQQVLPPFNQIIEQIKQVAALPVWRHPESTPLDFLVEQAAQRAVRALRHYDEHRASRLANLAFRYELMTIDLRQHKELESVASFLDALAALVQNDGQHLPTVESALEEPYATILAAVYQAGQEKEKED